VAEAADFERAVEQDAADVVLVADFRSAFH
jgi:hypothetical protein